MYIVAVSETRPAKCYMRSNLCYQTTKMRPKLVWSLVVAVYGFDQAFSEQKVIIVCKRSKLTKESLALSVDATNIAWLADQDVCPLT
jgi:hypothetical protein